MPDNMPAPVPPAETVSCRPSAVYWVFAAFGMASGLMAWFGAHNPNRNGPLSAGGVLFIQIGAAALLGTAAILAVWLTRARIVADADGLRWRRLGGWKSARWEDVQDFYDRLPSSMREARLLSGVIQTAAGGVRFSREWTHADALRAVVAARATHAAARQWDVLGSRPCDQWPRVFRYDTWQNIWTPRIILKLLLTALGYAFAKPLGQAVSLAGSSGWPMMLALLAPYLFLLVLYGGPALLALAQYRAAGRRKAERIMADTNGITFEDGARRVQAAWAEVTGYGLAHGPGGVLTVRSLVETAQGDFDFLATLADATLLQIIIRRYALSAADKDWRPRVDRETLGGEAARWSGGRIGAGARVYHYRTRSHRALLWLPLSLGVTMLLMARLTALGLTRSGSMSVPGCLLPAVVLGLLWLAGAWAYRVCRVETDEDGLTQVTLWGRHRLLWNQVEDYWLTGEDNTGVVQGRGKRLRFRREIVGFEELTEVIARRATACGGRAWEPTTTSQDARRRGRTGRGWSGPG